MPQPSIKLYIYTDQYQTTDGGPEVRIRKTYQTYWPICSPLVTLVLQFNYVPKADNNKLKTEAYCGS